ncbi:unnamed protein product [Brachionus calyciflorus]|uniref:F-box domain-containing protein n=1 Tax=Brachionus calyciflorus TaxID=104777 RepID=A0A813MB62_9BILA|nr:unnamed protein product [Brachionus calyciflorus]
METNSTMYKDDRMVYYQFVHNVLDFSSQYGKEHSRSYTVSNIRGGITNFPRYGDFLESCVMRTYGPWWQECNYLDQNIKQKIQQPLFISQDFIEVEFELKCFINSVAIYENFNPGSIVAIYAFDFDSDKWVKLWSIFEQMINPSNSNALKRTIPRKESRKFMPNLMRKDIFSNLLRIEMEHSQMEYYSELDAIELIGATYDIFHNKKVARNLKAIGDDFFKKCSIETSFLNENIEDETRIEIKEISKDINIIELPDELLDKIISFLDLKTVFSLRSTCIKFYNLCNDKDIYKNLNIKPFWNCVNDKFLETLSKITDEILILDLSWTKFKQSIIFEKFLKNSCCQLTFLKMECCSYLDSKMLEIICDNCKFLTHLDIASCLNITSEEKPAFASISKLKNLEHLKLYRTKVDQNSMFKIIESCQNLKYLNIGSCFQLNDFDSIMSCISENLKQIESLDLWRSYSLTNLGLKRIASKCKNLKELDLGWCKNVTSYEWLRILLENCKDLRKLFLTSHKITDNEILLIAKHGKKLEQLDFLGSPFISTENIELTLRSCPNLKLLDISFCSNVDFEKILLISQFFSNCSIKRSYQGE